MPIGVAANVSGSTVAVIAEDVAEDGVFDCTARTSQVFPIAFHQRPTRTTFRPRVPSGVRRRSRRLPVAVAGPGTTVAEVEPLHRCRRARQPRTTPAVGLGLCRVFGYAPAAPALEA